MLSGCYIPFPHIHKYNIRYKRDKASGIWFDPPIFLWSIKFIFDWWLWIKFFKYRKYI